MEYLYYIFESASCGERSQEFKELGLRIYAFKNNLKRVNFDAADGPYLSIRNLKKNSPIFKKNSKNSKLIQRILKDENIIYVVDYIFTKKGKPYNYEFINLIEHVEKGMIKDKKVYGIHYFEQSRMRIKKIINQKNSLGVWTAIVEIWNTQNSSWVTKNEPTDFFPTEWSINELFHECYYAFIHKIKDNTNKYRYSSRTLSGIEVVIIVKDGIVKTIYPVYK